MRATPLPPDEFSLAYDQIRAMLGLAPHDEHTH